jgi:tRNA A37 methylthiotransferase MiaB
MVTSHVMHVMYNCVCMYNTPHLHLPVQSGRSQSLFELQPTVSCQQTEGKSRGMDLARPSPAP